MTTLQAARRLDYTGGSGERPTIVFLHDEESAAPELLAALAERGDVIAPIHPGFADEPRPSWVTTVRDIADVDLDALDGAAGELIVIGSSFGGWVAAELALRIPERIARLILVGPLGLHVAGSEIADHWFRTAEERAAVLYADPANKPEISIPESIANDESMARYGWNPRLTEATLGPRLRRLDRPVELLWGEADAFVPPAFAEAWQSLLPQATTTRVAGSGHFPIYETRAAVLDALDRALIAAH